VLAQKLHGLEPDEAFCAALQTATGGNPLFVGAVLDAVAREGTSPTAEHVPRLLELVDLGAALRRANQRTEARELLREGVDLARTVGALALAKRANEEIAATGARPRKVLQTGVDALTASERRVAQLAADGMSNKEIAQTLFVTIKTVEEHLSHAYRKLEINSRAQLENALLPTPTSPAPTSA
jgi:DNA-binding NarL/FixJ family response regulator